MRCVRDETVIDRRCCCAGFVFNNNYSKKLKIIFCRGVLCWIVPITYVLVRICMQHYDHTY